MTHRHLQSRRRVQFTQASRNTDTEPKAPAQHHKLQVRAARKARSNHNAGTFMQIHMDGD
jgi:hypothetical protein